MTEQEIEVLALQMSIGLTEAILELFRAHERVQHGDEMGVSWEWRNHHSVKIRETVATFLRELNAERESA